MKQQQQQTSTLKHRFYSSTSLFKTGELHRYDIFLNAKIAFIYCATWKPQKEMKKYSLKNFTAKKSIPHYTGDLFSLCLHLFLLTDSSLTGMDDACPAQVCGEMSYHSSQVILSILSLLEGFCCSTFHFEILQVS